MSTDGGAPYRFDARVDLDAGSSTVTVQAKDGQNNLSTKAYSVPTTGTSKHYEYDGDNDDEAEPMTVGHEPVGANMTIKIQISAEPCDSVILWIDEPPSCCGRRGCEDEYPRPRSEVRCPRCSQNVRRWREAKSSRNSLPLWGRALKRPILLNPRVDVDIPADRFELEDPGSR